MKIKILSMSYGNFKRGTGSHQFDGRDATIYGTNRAGKTRCMEAWQWLLTGMDSRYAAQFGIKPISGLESNGVVFAEAEIDMDGGKKVILRREMSEKWTTPRNQTVAEFSGHTTEYFIDGSPVGQRGFDKFVEKLAEKSVFPAFTHLAYFNEKMDSVPTDGKKKKISNAEAKRIILLSMIPEVTDSDVIASNPDFARLPEILKDKTADAYRLELDYQKGKILDARAEIPTRIDEAKLKIIKGIDLPALKKEKAEVESQISVGRNELSMIENGGNTVKLRNEKIDLQEKIQVEKEKARKTATDERTRLASIFNYCRDSKDEHARAIKKLASEISDLEGRCQALLIAKKDFADAWKKARGITFTPQDIDAPCQACGALPEYQINLQPEKLEAAFNVQKAEKISSIEKSGFDINEQIKGIEKDKAKLVKKLADLQSKTEAIEKDFTEAQKAYAAEPILVKSTEQLEYENRIQTIDVLLAEIADGSKDQTEELYAGIKEFEERLSEINAEISRFSSSADAEKRIQELKAEEKDLNKTLSGILADLQFMQDFIRAKCRMLTNKIDSLFNVSRWRLFEEQINGGIKDCCIAMGMNNHGEWVPYDDLNTEGRVNVNIDCVNTLGKHYGLTLPLWIDDADLVVEKLLSETPSQLIRLVVSETDEDLRIEVK